MAGRRWRHYVRARRAERLDVLPLIVLATIVALVGRSLRWSVDSAIVVVGAIAWDYARWRRGR
jgi:hypothetical protein